LSGREGYHTITGINSKLSVVSSSNSTLTIGFSKSLHITIQINKNTGALGRSLYA